MPQKRNPISSELMLAAAKAVRQHAGLMLDAAIQDFERATGPWHAEWIAIPESFVLTAGSLHQAKFVLGGLIVDEATMAKNLDISRGLIVAEAVMMGLAPQLGRQEAHDLVYDACRRANEEHSSLRDALSADPKIASRIDHATIDRLTSPATISGWRLRWSIVCWLPSHVDLANHRRTLIRHRDIEHAELDALAALIAVDRKRARDMQDLAALGQQRIAELLADRAKRDGIDHGAVAGLEAQA
jgi:hypothetical protein